MLRIRLKQVVSIKLKKKKRRVHLKKKIWGNTQVEFGYANNQGTSN